MRAHVLVGIRAGVRAHLHHANKPSIQDERRENLKCVFLKIMFCSERSISTYPDHK